MGDLYFKNWDQMATKLPLVGGECVSFEAKAIFLCEDLNGIFEVQCSSELEPDD